MNAHLWRHCFIVGVMILALLTMPAGATGTPQQASTGSYRNPLPIQIPGDGQVESCADPSIIYGPDSYWYMYCTTDPLNDQDRNAGGDFNFHLIPILRSLDLVSWTYVGDAFDQRPGWVADDAGLWAPDIEHFNDRYYLYYTASNTDLPGGGSAIGVATAPSPAGPWTDSGEPAVEPHEAPCCPGSRRWVFDPDVIQAGDQRYIFYGSYFGGISARELSDNGLHSDPATQVQITIANRYEGAYVVEHEGYYYLFASATNCCNGPLTGYSVFVGRSTNVLGPYVDREGVALLAGRVGGTPVISMNGNRWVGPGHNAVFRDFDGQDWFLYHAIDQGDPYFADPNPNRINKRPALLDPLDWIDGWPTVRGGQWASDTLQHAPAAQPGNKSQYEVKLVKPDELGDQIDQLSDEFNSDTLSAQWSWVRGEKADAGLTGDAFRFETQSADLFVDSNDASVLTEDAPNGNYVVETKVALNLPAEGCCFNYTQAGLVIYGDDDNFIKLVHVSIWETRQTEFAKELSPVPTDYPRYGNTVVGPPSGTTWLRIVKRTRAGEELYTAYTSADGQSWVRGGVWTHNLGNNARIGLVSMGGAGFTARFDYIRVYELGD